MYYQVEMYKTDHFGRRLKLLRYDAYEEREAAILGASELLAEHIHSDLELDKGEYNIDYKTMCIDLVGLEETSKNSTLYGENVPDGINIDFPILKEISREKFYFYAHEDK